MKDEYPSQRHLFIFLNLAITLKASGPQRKQAFFRNHVRTYWKVKYSDNFKHTCSGSFTGMSVAVILLSLGEGPSIRTLHQQCFLGSFLWGTEKYERISMCLH